jgi:hypothetical protein
MDVDRIDINAMNPRQRDDYMRRGLCFHCNQQGHIARLCPQRPPYRPRNQNRDYQQNGYQRQNNYQNQGPSRYQNYQPRNAGPSQPRNTTSPPLKGAALAAHIRSLTDHLSEQEMIELNQISKDQPFH